MKENGHHKRCGVYLVLLCISLNKQIWTSLKNLIREKCEKHCITKLNELCVKMSVHIVFKWAFILFYSNDRYCCLCLAYTQKKMFLLTNLDQTEHWPTFMHCKKDSVKLDNWIKDFWNSYSFLWKSDAARAHLTFWFCGN